MVKVNSKMRQEDPAVSNVSPTEMEPSSLKKKDNPQLSSTLVKQFLSLHRTQTTKLLTSHKIALQ